MRIEELLRTMLRSFFVITTGIIASIYVFCAIFNTEAVFSLVDIGRVLLMALISDLPYVLFYSRRELGKKQMLIRMAIHFPVLLALLLYFAHSWEWVNFSTPTEVIVLVLLIIGVYAVVLAVSAYQDKRLAAKLNDRLKRRYNS